MTRRERERLIVEDDLATAARAALLAEVAAFDRGDHLVETPADTARIRAAAARLRQLDDQAPSEASAEGGESGR